MKLQSSLEGEVQTDVAHSVDAVTGVAGRWQSAVQQLKVKCCAKAKCCNDNATASISSPLSINKSH